MITSTRKKNNTIWISHSGISDFGNCPQLYYFKSIYRDPRTGRRIQAVNPFLTLGSVVHNVIEESARLPIEERLKISLKERFEKGWQFWRGKKGGFSSGIMEEDFLKRGLAMVEKFEKSPLMKAPNFLMGKSPEWGERDLPKVKLFKDEDLVLVGSIDWIEVLPNKSLHIIDFKTGKNKEDKNSLQLPIYHILASYNLKEPIERLSYWYLEEEREPLAMDLASWKEYIPIIRHKALEIKRAIKGNRLTCRSSNGECFQCRKYKKIALGQAEYVGYDEQMSKDLYFA